MINSIKDYAISYEFYLYMELILMLMYTSIIRVKVIIRRVNLGIFSDGFIHNFIKVYLT